MGALIIPLKGTSARLILTFSSGYCERLTFLVHRLLPERDARHTVFSVSWAIPAVAGVAKNERPSCIYVSPKDSQPLLRPRLRRRLDIESPTSDILGRPVTQLPQDLHFEESHSRVDSISKVGGPEIQAGFTSKAFSQLAAC